MADVSHSGITVSDLDRSLWFYGELLGMGTVRRYESNIEMARPMWKADGLSRLQNVVVQITGAEQQLQLTQADGTFQSRRLHLDSHPWDIGAAHLSLVVPDLEGLVGRLGEHGFEPRAGKISHGRAGGPAVGFSGALISDPDGFCVDLLQSPLPTASADVASIGVVVSDLAASVAFYSDVLGMDVLDRGRVDADFLADRWSCADIERSQSARVRSPGLAQTLLLLELHGPPQARLVSKQWDIGFAHACFTVDQFEQMIDRLGRKGLEPRAALRDSPAWAAGGHVPDPDGFDLEVLQLI
jgi:catechol 2,3-dioxygenase-like lactoylglutathione lyase family enzyme